ncbi:hypothetical protein [Actinacidiphila oryziradicis]|nr:hypothetical protein [Actinacidiphila oryziradicis]
MRAIARQMVLDWASALVGTAALVAVVLPLRAAAGDDGVREVPYASSTTASNAPGSYGLRTAAAPAGHRNDPLTADEIERARNLALTGDRALRTMSEDVRGRAGAPQYVSTDLAEGTAADGRRAEVSFYDYRDDTLIRRTVDLATGQVVRTETASGVQPVPSGAEAREAAAILLRDPSGGGVKQDFEAATGVPLTDVRQLSVQAMAYRGAAGRRGPDAECGKHRCVRLFTRVKDGPWIDTRHYVVDLSARTTIRLP